MSGIKWSKEEDSVVLSNYKKLTAKKIGLLINRSETAVHIRAFKLNLRTAQKSIVIGQVFNHLTVTKFSDRRSSTRQSYVFCKCTCGIEKEFLSSNLNQGYTTSCGCTTRQRHGQVSYNSIYQAYKRGARDRNYEFNLDINKFIEIISKNCFYCNSSPKPHNHYLRKKSNKIRAKFETFEEAWVYINGIDRIDNTKGYIIDNVVPCCSICNMAKNDLSLDEFTIWIKNLYSNFIKKDT